MVYGITCTVSSPPGFIEISEQEFKEVRRAKRNLLRVVWIEDKFDLLLENYREYEIELLDLALYQMTFGDFSWTSFRFDALRVSRRLQNLLSACRLYLDQIKHDVGELEMPGLYILDRLKKKCSEEFNSKLGYRVMESLRNYTQHRSLPIHHMSYPQGWEPKDSPSSLVFRVIPSLSIAELRADPKVKPSVIKELKSSGKYFPVTPLIREYVEGLGAVHQEFRSMSKSYVAQWECVLKQVCDRAAAAFDGRKSGLTIVARDEEGQQVDSEDVFEDPIVYRSKLVRKNRSLTKLSARFVSSECPPKKKA